MILNNENIHASIKEFEKQFPEDLQTRLMIEEVLLNFRDHFGTKAEYGFRVRRRPFGFSRVLISLKGEPFNPLAESKEDNISLILSSLMEDTVKKDSYRYLLGTNFVRFTLAKDKKSRKIPGGNVTIAALLAVICGLAFRLVPEAVRLPILNDLIEPVSSRLPKVISALSVPLIFVSILTGICALDEISSLSSLGSRVIKRFFLTILFVMGVTFPFCLLFFPNTLSFGKGGFEVQTLITFLLDIIPTNVFTPFTEGRTAQVVFLAFVAGIALLTLSDTTARIRALVPELNALLLQMMKSVSFIIPAVVFLSLFKTFAGGDLEAVVSSWRFVAVNYLATITAVALTVLRLPVFHRYSALTFIKKLQPLLVGCFATGSHSIFTNLQYELAEKELEIPKQLYSFWIPLAHALFAVSNIVPLFASVFFNAYTNHLEVTFSKLILIVLLLIELAIASPKVPGGILATYSLLFAEIGLPDNVLGLLMASNVFLINFEVAAGMLLKFSDLEDLHLRMQKEKAANH